MTPAVPLFAYQKRWFLDRSRFKIGMFARQTGKTFTTTLEIVDDCYAAFSQGRAERWVILSRGERQAREAMDEGVKRHAKAYGMVFRESEYDFKGETDVYKALEVTLPGGSRITALPANPDTARGYSANVFLDEFAIHADSRAIWGALFPIISKRGLKLRVTSTPKGRNNKFFEIWTGKDGVWSRHEETIYDAVREGLDRDIEEMRAGLADEELWAQEFECQFIDDARTTTASASHWSLTSSSSVTSPASLASRSVVAWRAPPPGLGCSRTSRSRTGFSSARSTACRSGSANTRRALPKTTSTRFSLPSYRSRRTRAPPSRTTWTSRSSRPRARAAAAMAACSVASPSISMSRCPRPYLVRRERPTPPAPKGWAAATSIRRSERTSSAQALKNLDDWRGATLASVHVVEAGYDDFYDHVQDIYNDKLKQIYQDDLSRRKDWQAGIQRGLDDINKAQNDWATKSQQLIEGAAQNFEDDYVDAVLKQKDPLSAFFDWFAEQILRLTYERYAASTVNDLLGSIVSGVGDALGLNTIPASGVIGQTVDAGVHHDGSMVGSATSHRAVDISLFQNARRAHTGTILGAGEVPIIAKQGEGIFTPKQMDTAGNILDTAITALSRPIVVPLPANANAAPKIEVHTHDAPGTKSSVRQTQQPNGSMRVDIFNELVDQVDGKLADKQRHGTSQFGTTIADTHGLERIVR